MKNSQVEDNGARATAAAPGAVVSKRVQPLRPLIRVLLIYARGHLGSLIRSRDLRPTINVNTIKAVACTNTSRLTVSNGEESRQCRGRTSDLVQREIHAAIARYTLYRSLYRAKTIVAATQGLLRICFRHTSHERPSFESH